MGKSLLLPGILLSLSLRAYFIFHGSQIADVHALNEMGQMVLRGINPYLALNYYTYPPLALYLEAFIANLSQTIHIPFYILTKILPNLADVLTTLLIYWFLIKKSIRPFSAACWSLAFFLNPLSIIISSAHGQLDSIPIFLTVCAIFIVVFKTKLNFVLLAGGVLGLAIAIKPGPLMLLPFLQGSPNLVLQKVINYSGSYDFGLSAILSTRLGAISLYQPQFMLVYFVGNLIYWPITLYWLFKLVSKTRYPSRDSTRYVYLI